MLRFPVNSMQCANATWKEALQHLLDRADVVIMDLASLSEQNRGVAYELGKLVDEIPFNRVVLLFDDSTDLTVLKDILAQAAGRMATDSPNRPGVGLASGRSTWGERPPASRTNPLTTGNAGSERE